MILKTLATAIYYVNQALMAANCGAAYVAPYVNRMCNLEVDGIQATLDMQRVFKDAWEKAYGTTNLITD